jgi:hypothetical protein
MAKATGKSRIKMLFASRQILLGYLSWRTMALQKTTFLHTTSTTDAFIRNQVHCSSID